MYVNNIISLINENIPVKYKFFEGNMVFGKIVELQDGKKALRLYDGTLIPSILVSEKNLEQEKFMKFRIEGYDNDNIILRPISVANYDFDDDLTKFILKDLNIPEKEGKNIIASLVKFNLPATNENILNIYKHQEIINAYANYTDEDIEALLAKFINEPISKDSSEFKTAKELFTNLKAIDTDFLTFLLDNKVPLDINNVTKTQNLIEDKFLINELLNKFKEFLTEKNNEQFKLISLNDLKEKISENQNFTNTLPPEFIKKLVDNIDILKYLYDNYNMYYFNSYNENNFFKNNIIIKNRYKNHKYIDINDVKIYISVDTPKLGIVEGFVQKKFSDLYVTIKADKKYLSIINKNVNTLKNNLYDKGYGQIYLSVDSLDKANNIVELSNFFKNNILKKLDVKV